MCLGAQFVFFGRPTLYGAVAGGLPGVKKAIDIFRSEIDLVMGQIGCPSLDQLGPPFLAWAGRLLNPPQCWCRRCPQSSDQPQDVLEHPARHRDLGHLERNVAAMRPWVTTLASFSISFSRSERTV